MKARAGIAALLADPFVSDILAGRRDGMLLLDYDGTLAPFVQKRDEARPYAGVVDILARLPVRGPGRFVVVTGRRATELIPFLMPAKPMEIWGCHGAERLPADRAAGRLDVPPAEAQVLARALELAQRMAPPDALEQKPVSLALHWRGLDEAKRKYRAMKEEIERMVGEINGRYSMPGWAPVHFTYRNLPPEELIAYYMASDMALVTPLRDGMNLVAKEYAACNIRETGILCLSEFAGAAMELHRHATMVNPFDVDGVAAAIRDGAFMDIGLRRRRMRSIRAIVRRYDIFWWVDAFLEAAFSTHLEAFPQNEAAYWADLEQNQGPPWDIEPQA
ncbi:trehalose-6-phosphate synthase [Desulfovibrio sp. TomC]|uniref:trehalose-6-phosphate synthase n=1 Tax=Desulfovibrio sp. TomC TaxID=1562888 RepID=UPI0005750EB7|nr:trehalose-6-phosphate synthase [Desulfovibrio sp. TomC]KHK00882.1 Alpha,alpha-trehalose-phosphate synthase (UDP-forming) [Desulfovibrio sp. TomC]